MIYIVSDLHGATDALKKAVPEGSTLLLLGDLVNLIDYTTMTGILIDVFSAEAVSEVMSMRAEGRYDEALNVITQRASGREQEVKEQIGGRVRVEYEHVFGALPHPTYLILGNVDWPPVAHAFAQSAGVYEPDGQVIVLEGERFGFVGGALPTPLHVAGEIPEEELRAKVEGLGEVDVLCSHIPPAVPELCWDTLAGHMEEGSTDLLRYVEEVQPRLHYFGHVHQPLVSSLWIGRTLCVNVGYFRATQRAFPHSSEQE